MSCCRRRRRRGWFPVARRSEPPAGSADADLWARVTATVRPLGAKAAPAAEPRSPRVRVRAEAIEAPDISRGRAITAPEAASLDGGWDRRARKGDVEPERTIDLHGFTADAAYTALSGAIERAWRDQIRTLLVITGKPRAASPGDERPRGVIASNFARWVATPRLRPFIAAVRQAHQRHGGGGARYVILRRQR